MKTSAIGYGMGKKDFPQANCLRAMLGETAETGSVKNHSADSDDTVLELSCNVDDMTAEAVSFAMDRLFDGGALEVYTAPIGMKKSRPGTLDTSNVPRKRTRKYYQAAVQTYNYHRRKRNRDQKTHSRQKKSNP